MAYVAGHITALAVGLFFSIIPGSRLAEAEAIGSGSRNT